VLLVQTGQAELVMYHILCDKTYTKNNGYLLCRTPIVGALSNDAYLTSVSRVRWA